MTIWIIALILLACTGIVGYYQGGLRAAFSFVGLLVASLFATPLGSILKSMLPIFGLKNPFYIAFLGPIVGFLIILIVFKVAALAVHKKVEGWYKYKANDTQRMLFERMNTRVGAPMGLANGLVYLLAIGTLIYSLGYLTVQVATSDQDSWAIRLVNHLAEDAESTGLNKAVAPFVTKSTFYYDAADVVADIFQTPLLQNRLANYPALLLLSEKEEYKPLSMASFQSEWIKGMTFGSFVNHESVKPLIENHDAYTNLLGLLGGEVSDLKSYLETGKSPRFDDERILGRWAFDFKASMNLARRRKPNMGSAEITQLRKYMATSFKDAMLIATVDHKTILKIPAAGKDKALRGTWKNSGSNYVLISNEGDKNVEVDANVEGRNIIFTKGGLVLVFENTRV